MRRVEQEEQDRRRGFVPGLIFAWRVRRRGYLGRMVLSIFLVLVGGVGFAALVGVQGRPASSGALRQSSAGVIVLRSDEAISRDLIEWARENSPDAVRWEPEIGPALEEALCEVDQDLRAAARYQPRLLPSPVREVWPAEDSLLPLIAPGLPPVAVELPVDPDHPEAEVRARVQFLVSSGLEDRWSPLEAEWPQEDLRSFIGREAVFSIGVDAEGQVVFCLPMRGIEPEFDQKLQQALIRHVLAPGAEDVGVALGRLTIRVRPEVTEGEGE